MAHQSQSAIDIGGEVDEGYFRGVSQLKVIKELRSFKGDIRMKNSVHNPPPALTGGY